MTEQNQNMILNEKQLQEISKVMGQLGLEKSIDLNSILSSIPTLVKNNASITSNPTNVVNYASLLQGIPIQGIVEKLMGKKSTSNQNLNQQLESLKADVDKLKRQNQKLNGTLQDVLRELRRGYY